MAAPPRQTKKSSNAVVGFESTLWLAADKLRNNLDAAEYKHVVLGLIFLKYISDAFEEMRVKLIEGKGDYEGANPEDPDEYRAEQVFWVPKQARWSHLQSNAKQPTIGKLVDDAMLAIERDNPRLKGVLPKDYARPALDKHRLGELIDLIGTILLRDPENRSKDVLGPVYEYFLSQFASAEGKKGGQFYTPNSIVRLLVEMLAPYKGRIYDPCCGSGGMFVQPEKFVEAHGGTHRRLGFAREARNCCCDSSTTTPICPRRETRSPRVVESNSSRSKYERWRLTAIILQFKRDHTGLDRSCCHGEPDPLEPDRASRFFPTHSCRSRDRQKSKPERTSQRRVPKAQRRGRTPQNRCSPSESAS